MKLDEHLLRRWSQKRLRSTASAVVLLGYLHVFSKMFHSNSCSMIFQIFSMCSPSFSSLFPSCSSFFSIIFQGFSHHFPGLFSCFHHFLWFFRHFSQVIPSLHLDELSQRGVNMETARFFRNDFEEQRGTENMAIQEESIPPG